MTQREISEVLDLHLKWLNTEPEGARANLCDADLRDADLSGADLRGADLHWANLCDANLRGADLCGADLRWADLSGVILRDADLGGANLRGADLRDADLSRADLSGANLSGANLSGADLRWADLSGVILRDADLRGADLRGVRYDEHTSFYALQCPEEGVFIAWKKAGVCIIKLRIPADALRTSSTSRKCRANKAEVLGIYDKEKNLLSIDEIRSDYDESFIYRVGEIVTADNFEENRWIECAAGIHFFLTFDEAKNY